MRPSPSSRPVLRLAIACAATAACATWALSIAVAADAEEARRKKGELEVVSRTTRDDAADGLFCAAELGRSGAAFYAGLFARGFATDAAVRTATLDLSERAARGLARRYVLKPAAGLTLESSAWAQGEVARLSSGDMVGAPASPRELLDRRWKSLARLSGLAQIPGDLSPVYAAATRRAASADGKRPGGLVLDSGALGFGLYAEAVLGGKLCSVRRVDGSVGETADAGFDGLVLLTCAEATLESLRSTLAFDGAAFGPAPPGDYDPFGAPRYIAHQTLASDGPGELRLLAEDKSMRLADAAAALLGAAELVRLSDPARSPETAGLFGTIKVGDGREEVFPQATIAGARDLVRRIFRNLAALHFDPDPQRLAFVADAMPGAKGTRVVTADAALTLMALEAAADAFPQDNAFRNEARKLTESQASFLIARMRPDGGLPGSFDITGAPGAPAPADVLGEALCVEAFLSAARFTGDDRYSEAAVRLARALDRRRFDPWVDLYLGEKASGEFSIGVRDGPALLGALRELNLASGAADALNRFRAVAAGLGRIGALPKDDGECATVVVRVKR